MDDKTALITAKQIVKKYKIAYATVNYYTMIGLLPLLAKKGNERVYDAREVKLRLEKISRLSREGYPLHLIRKQILGI